MTGDVFVDTNILVYSVDASEARKQVAAKRWLDHLWRRGTGRLSVQVLNEYYDIVTRKLKPGLDRQQARQDVRSFMAWHPLPHDAATIEAAWNLQDRFSLAWWDALVAAAAQRGGCRVLLSEDFQAGLRVDDLEVINPFHRDPDDALFVRDD
jgi:predicted nucleic acid-binding protein